MRTTIITVLFFLQLGIAPVIGQSINKHQIGDSKYKPNILFILIDDMGWNALSSYGGRYVKTPNIDQLAQQGMKFTQAYTAPMCSPARARLISGEYGVRTGIIAQGSGSPRNTPLLVPGFTHKLKTSNYTVANMLEDAGYTTMVSGKWNLGDAYRVADLKKKKGDSYFAPYGFDYIGDGHEKGWKQIDKDKGTPAIIADFFQFVDSGAGKQPFFAYLAFFAIHTPIDAPDSLVQVFMERGFPKSTDRFGNAKEKPTADYLAMIKYLDLSIGRLLDGLAQRNLANNTLVVFTSDNGGMNRDWDNFPLRGAKGLLYEGGIRVPLIVRWPGVVPAGSQTNVPVGMVDWYPTFKAIASASIPSSKVLDGVSLVPLLTQQGELHRTTLFWHRPLYRLDYGQTPASVIRSGDFKLIHYYGDYLDTRGYLPERHKTYGKLIVGEKNELFNIRRDPGERHDLSKKFPKKVQSLLDSLEILIHQTNAPLPKKNVNFDRSKWDSKN